MSTSMPPPRKFPEDSAEQGAGLGFGVGFDLLGVEIPLIVWGEEVAGVAVTVCSS